LLTIENIFLFGRDEETFARTMEVNISNQICWEEIIEITN